MRETRQSGSEGGEGSLPDPYHVLLTPLRQSRGWPARRPSTTTSGRSRWVIGFARWYSISSRGFVACAAEVHRKTVGTNFMPNRTIDELHEAMKNGGAITRCVFRRKPDPVAWRFPSQKEGSGTGVVGRFECHRPVRSHVPVTFQPTVELCHGELGKVLRLVGHSMDMASLQAGCR
jgi:hypothetical protein